MLDFQKINMFYNNSKKNIDENVIKDIRNQGIYKSCFNTDVINKTENTFNLELPEYKIYNQGESYSCWIYAYTSFIKPLICKNLNIADEDLDLSINYIHFFDRLEKSNSLYEEVIHNAQNYTNKIDEKLIDKYIHCCGSFDSAKDIIQKYGIVPECEMPMNINNYEPFVFDKLFKEKVKKDILQILRVNDIEELENLKNRYLEENYILLSKVFGNPPISFDFIYKDINNKENQLINITPIEFLEKCFSENLDDFIFIMNDNNKEFYKVYPYNDSEKIYKKEHYFYNLPLNIIKDLIIKQLKAGTPVWFGCDFTAVCGSYTNKVGILDSNLFRLDSVLGIEIIPKHEQEKFIRCNYHHAMIIVGAQIENGKIIRWKVQNSFGKENNQNGYFVMNDNYFDQYCVMFGINKKYIQKD